MTKTAAGIIEHVFRREWDSAKREADRFPEEAERLFMKGCVRGVAMRDVDALVYELKTSIAERQPEMAKEALLNSLVTLIRGMKEPTCGGIP